MVWYGMPLSPVCLNGWAFLDELKVCRCSCLKSVSKSVLLGAVRCKCSPITLDTGLLKNVSSVTVNKLLDCETLCLLTQGEELDLILGVNWA